MLMGLRTFRALGREASEMRSGRAFCCWSVIKFIVLSPSFLITMATSASFHGVVGLRSNGSEYQIGLTNSSPL